MHEATKGFEMPTEGQVEVASDAFRSPVDPTRFTVLSALLR
jgi:hypothetical protein